MTDSKARIRTLQVIDSHTGGEPTRVVLDGGPDLGAGPLAERLDRCQDQFDSFRRAVVTEPRGSDVLVGALLVPPHAADCDFGVVFFNNVGLLGMCGHGMIGVIETLKYLGRLDGNQCRIETPVGSVACRLHEDQSVSIENVDSYRTASDVKLDVDGIGTVVGDVAWGGNWFFLVREPQQDVSIDKVTHLSQIAVDIRTAVHQAGFPQVDHIELFGKPDAPDADLRNFVLCPGLEFDRSPCGTGTSAKLACLAADGKVLPGQAWVQEGVLGSTFVSSFQWADQSKSVIRPEVRGRAFITAESQLRMDSDDPFAWGIGALRGAGVGETGSTKQPQNNTSSS
ncbi:MAG: proline racemase family protein [Rubripirellula sp.]|nr:proline racemase family protein [Rubripirellula sp.]